MIDSTIHAWPAARSGAPSDRVNPCNQPSSCASLRTSPCVPHDPMSKCKYEPLRLAANPSPAGVLRRAKTCPVLALPGAGRLGFRAAEHDRTSVHDHSARSPATARSGWQARNVGRAGAVIDGASTAPSVRGAPLLRAARGGAARQRDGDPDRRRQGLRRLRDRAGHGRSVVGRQAWQASPMPRRPRVIGSTATAGGPGARPRTVRAC